MGRIGLCVGLAITALTASGCGTAVPADDATVTPIGVVHSPTVDDGPPSPVFPLTLRRTGGIAGFDDTVVLRANGQVLVDTRSVHGRTCTLTGPQQKQLLTALGTVRLNGFGPEASEPADTGSGEGEGPDRITISITDQRARPIDLSDPSLGDVAGMVGALVTDVTLSSPATTTCTTPTPPTIAPPA
jgi:hypothetical protein